MANGKKNLKKPMELKYKGDLVIGQVEEMRKNLVKDFLKNSVASIHFDEVHQIDLSGIQLIQSLVKTIEASGRPVTIKADLPTEYKKILIKTGFKNFLKQVTLSEPVREAADNLKTLEYTN